MDSDDLVCTLDRDGYAVVEARLDAQDIATSRRHIVQFLRDVRGVQIFGGLHTKRLWVLVSHSRPMDRAALDPIVLDLVDELIGPGAIALERVDRGSVQ